MRYVSECFGSLVIGISGVAGIAVLVSPAQAQQRIAQVRFIKHGLQVQPAGGSLRKAHLKQPLFPAAFLRTRKAEIASVRFVDGSELHINQHTDLVLRSSTLAILKKGEGHFLDVPGTHHQIQTSAAIASATGTSFDVVVAPKIPYTINPGGTQTLPGCTPRTPPGSPQSDSTECPPGTTTVSVVQGTVTVSNSKGYVTVHPGEWVHVIPGQAPTPPAKHNAAGEIVWSNPIP